MRYLSRSTTETIMSSTEAKNNLLAFPFPSSRKSTRSAKESLLQKAPLISVTKYTETPKYLRVWRSKKHQCGLYTRKKSVNLIVTTKRIMEEVESSSISKRIEMDLAFIDLAFIGAHHSGKCRFLIADTKSHIKRMYEGNQISIEKIAFLNVEISLESVRIGSLVRRDPPGHVYAQGRCLPTHTETVFS